VGGGGAEFGRGSLGVAAAGLQVCPWAPAAATRRLPPAPMRSISGSVRWDSGTTRSGRGAMWPRGRAPSGSDADGRKAVERSDGERAAAEWTSGAPVSGPRVL